MTDLELRDVTKTYGDVDALAGVDLTIEPGRFHCLVGPNGSGKSTLFDLLLGLQRPTAGTVSAPRDAVGCSFQRPTVYPDLSVAENLRVFANLAGTDDAWVETLVVRFALDAVRDRVVRTLSGGFTQRLDLALAVVGRPAYVVVDEPFTDLDAPARERLVDFLEEYRTGDRSVLVSTHEVEAFGPSVDRFTVLDDGAVAFDGAADAATAVDALENRMG